MALSAAMMQPQGYQRLHGMSACTRIHALHISRIICGRQAPTILQLVHAFSTSWCKKLSEVLLGALCRRAGASGYEHYLTVSAMAAGASLPQPRSRIRIGFVSSHRLKEAEAQFDSSSNRLHWLMHLVLVVCTVAAL